MGGYLTRLGPVFNLNDEQGSEWETADVPSHRPPVCLVKSSQTHLRYSRLTLFTPLDRHSFLFLGLSPTLFFKVILYLFPYIVVTTCILLRQAPLFGLSLAPTTPPNSIPASFVLLFCFPYTILCLMASHIALPGAARPRQRYRVNVSNWRWIKKGFTLLFAFVVATFLLYRLVWTLS